MIKNKRENIAWKFYSITSIILIILLSFYLTSCLNSYYTCENYYHFGKYEISKTKSVSDSNLVYGRITELENDMPAVSGFLTINDSIRIFSDFETGNYIVHLFEGTYKIVANSYGGYLPVMLDSITLEKNDSIRLDFFLGYYVHYDGVKRYVNPLKNGYHKEYYSNGSIKEECHFLRGLKHGICISYNIFGNKQYEGKYYKNFMEGEWIFYNESGQIRSNVNFIKSTKNGKSLEYFDNGSVKEVEYFKNGLLEGENIEYYETGEIKAKRYYHKDKACGIWYWYNKNGTIEKQKEMNNNCP